MLYSYGTFLLLSQILCITPHRHSKLVTAYQKQWVLLQGVYSKSHFFRMPSSAKLLCMRDMDTKEKSLLVTEHQHNEKGIQSYLQGEGTLK